MTGGDEKIFDISFNPNYNQYRRISMQQAGIKQGSKGFEKDKANEKKSEIDQRTTARFSDGVDTRPIGAHVFH